VPVYKNRGKSQVRAFFSVSGLFMTPFTTPSGTSDHSKTSSPAASNLTLPEPRWRVRILCRSSGHVHTAYTNLRLCDRNGRREAIHDRPRRFAPQSTQPHVLPRKAKSTGGSSSVDPIPQNYACLWSIPPLHLAHCPVTLSSLYYSWLEV